jgi:hypothetical protein
VVVCYLEDPGAVLVLALSERTFRAVSALSAARAVVIAPTFCSL